MEKLNEEFHKKSHEKRHEKRHEIRKNRVGILGLVLIVAGLLIIGEQFEMFPYRVRDILFTWQALLIALGLIFASRRDGRLTGLILILIGGFFLLPRFTVLPVSTLKLFWPVLLIFFGLVILFKAAFGRGRGFGISASSTDGDVIEDVNVFGGHDRIITSENFRGGEVINVFGGGKYNMLQSKLAPGKNVIEVVMVFGGSKFIVPPGWDVKVEVAGVFGGFSDKRNITGDEVYDPSRTLVFKGIAIFGGGELSSYDN